MDDIEDADAVGEGANPGAIQSRGFFDDDEGPPTSRRYTDRECRTSSVIKWTNDNADVSA